jgi:hypothetical protein
LLGGVELIGPEPVRGASQDLEVSIPVRADLEYQLVAGESLDVYLFNGVDWSDSGRDGVVGTNVSYPDRLAVQVTLSDFGIYAVFLDDQDGDGIRDELDPDRDGDGAVNDADNCPDHANATQSDCDLDGAGDACDPDPCDAMQVVMSSLDAEPGRPGVLVTWTTLSESNVVGFQVLRAMGDLEPAVISAQVAATGTPLVGADYEYIDPDHLLNDTLYYWVESIGIDGTLQRFGPATLVPVRRPPGREDRPGSDERDDLRFGEPSAGPFSQTEGGDQ